MIDAEKNARMLLLIMFLMLRNKIPCNKSITRWYDGTLCSHMAKQSKDKISPCILFKITTQQWNRLRGARLDFSSYALFWWHL